MSLGIGRTIANPFMQLLRTTSAAIPTLSRPLTTYAKQHRGSPSAYDLYLQRMDAATRQKVAAVAAFLLDTGAVADMGMGSGAGSADIASLYPKVTVTGVDINPTMVEYAKKKYAMKNLRFIEGDIAKPCFPPNSLKGIINSSVLHHVTSFNGYDPNEARKAIANQVMQLEENGVLIIRDFVHPGRKRVILELPEETETDISAKHCSVNTLFHRFTKEFRSLSPSPGFSCVECSDRRYELEHKHAVEFILRKDYRDTWDVEIQEEYTYFTIDEFEEVFKRAGLRILSSLPLYNPWIVNNRFKNKFVIRNLVGEALDFPATNYVIVGEKVPLCQGVEIRERTKMTRHRSPNYLEMSHYKRTSTNQIFDLVERPEKVTDIIPYFKQNDLFYILARRGYPRPIVTCQRENSPALDGNRPVSYINEPLNIPNSEDSPVVPAAKFLETYGEFTVHHFMEGPRFFPSPGGVREEIHSLFAEIDPIEAFSPKQNLSGFSTSGLLHPIEANQLLLSAQVGTLQDVRLEMNAYALFLQERHSPPSWIGDEIKLKEGTLPNVTPFEVVKQRPPRKLYEKVSTSSNFLDLFTGEFVEFNARGEKLASKTLEFVTPRSYSNNTVAVALLRKANGIVYIGVEDDDLPAAQFFNGRSDMLVAPAWRIPRDIKGVEKSRSWIVDRFKTEYGIDCRNARQLGGHYYPSPGITPEVVFPLAIEVESEIPSEKQLIWLSLEECVHNHTYFQDGHLRVMIFRAAAALGII